MLGGRHNFLKCELVPGLLPSALFCPPACHNTPAKDEASVTAPTLVGLQALAGIGPPTNSMLSMEGFQSMEGTYGRFIDRWAGMLTR